MWNFNWVSLALISSLTTLPAAAQNNAPSSIPGPASKGWMIYVGEYSYPDNNAKCQAFVNPVGMTAGLAVTKTYGPYTSSDEAEAVLRNSGWIRRVRFNQGGGHWLTGPGFC